MHRYRDECRWLTYKIFLRWCTGTTYKVSDIGIEIRLKSSSHICNGSSDIFLNDQITVFAQVCRPMLWIYSIRVWKISTTNGQILHGQRIERIRSVRNGDIVVNTSRDQLGSQYPAMNNQRIDIIHFIDIFSFIYQALWVLRYWKRLPEKGSMTNSFPLRSVIFIMVSSSIMFGLKWLDSNNCKDRERERESKRVRRNLQNDATDLINTIQFVHLPRSMLRMRL